VRGLVGRQRRHPLDGSKCRHTFAGGHERGPDVEDLRIGLKRFASDLRSLAQLLHPCRRLVDPVERDEEPQDQHDAVVGFTQLAHLRGLVIAERAHQIAGDDQGTAPDRDVDPLAAFDEVFALRSEQFGIEPRQEYKHQDAGERGQGGMPAPVLIRGHDRRNRIETQHHAL